MALRDRGYLAVPEVTGAGWWQCFHLRPDPQGQGSLRPRRESAGNAARLTGGRDSEPVLGAPAVAGEPDVAVQAVTGSVSRLAIPKLVCCGEATS